VRGSLFRRAALFAAFLIGVAGPLSLVALEAEPAAAAATTLTVGSQPPGTIVTGVPFGGPTINVTDGTNIVTTDESTTVTLTLVTVSGSGTLSGCSQGDPVTGNPETDGVIMFTGCKITSAGGGTFKIHAAAAGLTAVDSTNIVVNSDVLAAGGSDTIENFTKLMFQNTESSPNVVNIPVTNHLVGTLNLPTDTHCNAISFNAGASSTATTSPFLPPTGSGEGRNDLHNSIGKTWPTGSTGQAYTNGSGGTISGNGGCLDIARSSSKGSISGEEHYAFAVDAVSWATTSLKAPGTLTLTQLKAIWNCQVNDWSQVGGAPGTIQRVLPSFGSGTRAYFVNNVLGIPSSGSTQPVESGSIGWQPANTGTPAFSGFDSSTGQQVTAGTGTINCPVTIGNGGTPGDHHGVEENDGTQFYGGATSQTTLPSGAFDTHVNKTGLDTYIFPYSSGKWASQSTHAGNPTTDIRDGVRPGGLIGVVPSGATDQTAYPAAYTIRFNGDQFQLNNGSILDPKTLSGGATANNIRTMTVDATASDPTIVPQPPQLVTANPCNASNTFSQADVGFNMQETPSTHIFDGTSIIAVSADGCTATINSTIKTSGTGFTLKVGWAVVSEKNPNIPNFGATGGGPQYPGIRFVYFILEPSAPSYEAARALVGFDDNATHGNVSQLCNGVDVGFIQQEGFLDLARTVKASGNTNPLTCREIIIP
jgi:ABC-type phosphate transport system substrate-binding protein